LSFVVPRQLVAAKAAYGQTATATTNVDRLIYTDRNICQRKTSPPRKTFFSPLIRALGEGIKHPLPSAPQPITQQTQSELAYSSEPGLQVQAADSAKHNRDTPSKDARNANHCMLAPNSRQEPHRLRLLRSGRPEAAYTERHSVPLGRGVQCQMR